MRRATRPYPRPPLRLVRQEPDPQPALALADLFLAGAVAHVERTQETLNARRTVVHLRPVVPTVRAACEVLPGQACACGERLAVRDGRCDVCLLKGRG